MLKIVDLQVGNIGSVIKAVKQLGFPYEVIDSPSGLSNATKILLPGVGNFSMAATRLRESGFYSEIRKKILDQNIPILGICVGMQLLAKSGEEGNGNTEGLGFFDAKVKKINSLNKTLLVPHVGWNDVDTKNLPIFNGIENNSCFYFVHSFAMKLNESVNVAYTDYGENVVAYVNKNNIHGAQFHPEKSQDVGLKFLRNFIESC
ncbi:imidazole glycerol phosphate synthase subunit HisH [Pelagibaculum spongiae]|uniref:Imidazole glycerol phosphate synthase subunit HisH n=1 Tax=Pelagibaculum spongiae TaxID=2080658 RepID=A0A2V1GUX7_9GAMM|nr:imidazole glycerol phosphate synthase subunit HisH [Pelagibaculum spongiae]PVZ70205.1 imidazole glycerol phosphate synthase subunit HisH [Pelagibaculum spongiae]